MAAHAKRIGQQQRRSFTGARPIRGELGRRINIQDVIPVRENLWQAVRAAPGVDIAALMLIQAVPRAT
jgi:hypothetical protein